MLSLIVNPSSGGGRAGAVLPDVRHALDARGLEHHVELTRSLPHARELAVAAREAGEMAVALGGDGLIGAVADGLRDTDGVLGLLPAGRGNDFARVLGIPLDAVAACAVLSEGSVRSLDLGQIGETTFIGIASCGFDSEANRIANQTRLIRGNLVYTYGGIRALLSWRPARFELRIDGQPRSLTGYTVAVANSAAYGGGMFLAPGASLTDGLLDVVLIADQPRLRFLRHLPKVFKGEHVSLPEVSIVRAREVEVDADRKFTVYADGDPIAQLPVKVSVAAGAVRVMLPALDRAPALAGAG
ncbi:MAG TPA: diacylglycerol kinase family protein [Solirubrobacteraceae bacterium]|nr:diacylglycerol kinase family protein [Solirubrobacteraceae bacterium]